MKALHSLPLAVVALALLFPARGVAQAPTPLPIEEKVTLKPGWNLFSYYFDPPSTDPTAFFAPLSGPSGAVKIAMKWDNDTTTTTAPASGHWSTKIFSTPATIPTALPMLSDPNFGQMTKYKAYWLYVELPAGEDSKDFTTSGTLAASSVSFKRGWNLLGLNAGAGISVSGSREQTDFESILQGAQDPVTKEMRITQVYYLSAAGSTGFKPADAISPDFPYPSGNFTSGSGNWFYATKDFSLTPAMLTVFPPDTDVPPENHGAAASIGDIDRNRVYGAAGKIEDGDEMKDIVFRFQPNDDLVEDILPFTVANRTTTTTLAAGKTQAPGAGILNYTVQFFPYDPSYDGTNWDSATPTWLPDSYPSDSPYRTWLKILTPTDGKVLRPDGRVDTVVVQRAQPLTDYPVVNFVSSDIAGYTLVADRTGLPVNVKGLVTDSHGAPEPIAGKYVQGEIRIQSNDPATPVKRVRVRCEVPPIAGIFEGKAYVQRVNGVASDPAFSIDLSLSLQEDKQQRLRGVIDSERVLLYPRDVPITGSKLTDDGSKYILTGLFYLPKGDINRYPYDRFAGGPVDDGVNDVDWNNDGKYDNTNPLPYDIDRAMTLFATRESDRRLDGTFTETVSGITPDGAPLRLEGSFELNRLSYTPRKRHALAGTEAGTTQSQGSQLAWTNVRSQSMDPTGTSPYEELRSSIFIDRPLRIDKGWVDVDIEHPQVSDLEISLLAPDLKEYPVFPLAGAHGTQNFDQGVASLYESFVTNSPSTETRDRERLAPGLADINGLVVGGASLFGNATSAQTDTSGTLVEAPIKSIASFIDSSRTACLGTYSNPRQDCGLPAPQQPTDCARQVVISTGYLTRLPGALPSNELLVQPFRTADNDGLYSSGDPLTTGSLISVVAVALPNTKGSNCGDPNFTNQSWLTNINSFSVGLSYSQEILDFVDVQPLVSAATGTGVFPATPQADLRAGVLTVSGRTDANTFKSGGLFVARFRLRTVSADSVFAYRGSPLTIPAKSGSVNGVLEVPTDTAFAGTVRTAIVNALSVTHRATGDLSLWLVSPQGRRCLLMSGEGGDGDNILGTVFDDTAPNSILGAAAPFSGTFRPRELLGAAFGGAPASGAWKLRIENAGAFPGTLNNWGLQLSTELQPNYAISLAAQPSEWTLIVRDRQQGPANPVPLPLLVRWGLRVQTSGGNIRGSIVSKTTQSPVIGAQVHLLGREVVPSVSSDLNGKYLFNTEEFGTYVVSVSHPDYSPATAFFRFYESDNPSFVVPTIELQPLAGNASGTYTLEARPYESQVFTSDLPGTPGDDRLATTELLLTAPTGTSFAGKTLTFSIGGQTHTVTSFPSPAPLVRSTFSLGQGTYVDGQVTCSPGPFPGDSLSRSTILLPRAVIVRDQGPQPATTPYAVARYAFYCGTSNLLVASATTPPAPPDNYGKNMFFRDQGGFDIDRPSITGVTYPAPQDSEQFYYPSSPNNLFPVYCGATCAPKTFEVYPNPAIGPNQPQLRFRAFLSFNGQINGTAYGGFANPSTNAVTNVTCFAGALPVTTN